VADTRRSWRVHEFAELAGVTVKALHHYDRLGLLRPTRTESGYRVYTAPDLARLEQIIALKFIGIPLKAMRPILDRDNPSLPDVLRQQRHVLEEQRDRLERAITALRDAEHAIEADAETATSQLNLVIEAIRMQDIDVMQRYYTDEAWAEWRHRYEDWPSPEWRAFYADVAAAKDLPRDSDEARALARRWLQLTQADAVTPAVRTGMMKAWADREHWPPALKRRLAEFDVETATRFVSDVLWLQWEAETTANPFYKRHPHRASESRRRLFHEWLAVLDTDPKGPAAQRLVSRWRALLDEETGGDKQTNEEMLRAFHGRRNWPDGMTRYIASLYDTDAATFRRVSDFIEEAAAATSGS
jgi:MerR family transcriptional regulator, thiopeptide resistance regulator